MNKINEGIIEVFIDDEIKFMRIDLDGNIRWWQDYNDVSFEYIDSPEFEQLEKEYKERFEGDQKMLIDWEQRYPNE